MILATVNQSLQAILSGVPSSPWPWVTDVQDLWRVPSGAVTSTSFHGTLPSTAAVTLAPAPAATQLTRTILGLSITNVGSQSLAVRIVLNDNGTLFTLYLVTLDPGDTLTYQSTSGFSVVNAAGQVKTVAAITSSATTPLAVQLSDGQGAYDLLSLAPQLRALYRQGVAAHVLAMARTGQFIPMDPGLPF